MCNRYGYLAPVTRLVDEFSQTRIRYQISGDTILNSDSIATAHGVELRIVSPDREDE